MKKFPDRIYLSDGPKCYFWHRKRQTEEDVPYVRRDVNREYDREEFIQQKVDEIVAGKMRDLKDGLLSRLREIQNANKDVTDIFLLREEDIRRIFESIKNF